MEFITNQKGGQSLLQKEEAPVPAIYSEALAELSTQPDCSEVASSLPTFSSFSSILISWQEMELQSHFCLALVFVLYHLHTFYF